MNSKNKFVAFANFDLWSVNPATTPTGKIYVIDQNGFIDVVSN